MKSKEEQQADELDLILDALQSGRPVPPHPSLAVEDSDLLIKLVEMQQTSQLNPDFAGVLDKRLQKTASTHTRKSGFHYGGGFLIHSSLIWLSGLLKGITSMKHNLTFSLVGAAALTVIILAILLLNQKPEGLPIALISSQTPTALVTPQSNTPTPKITLTTPTGPSTTVLNPTANTPVVPATPTLVLPTSAPSLPMLALWLGSGYGGGGVSPSRYQFRLDTSLSNAANQATAYLQRQPAPINLQQATILAASLGLDQPQWFGNLAIQDPRQIVFENSDSFNYIDHSVFNFPGGRYYYPPDLYPPADLAAKNAQAFLNSAGLLNEPYTYTVQSEYVSFYRVLENQQTVYESFAGVTVGPDGKVGMVHFNRPGMDAMGVYPLISAEQAWQILISSQQNPTDANRVLIQARSTLNGNPRIWTRTYQNGQQANIYTPLTILQPSEADKSPYIRTSNGLVVQAAATSLQSLASDYRALVESSMDQGKAIRIWGTIQDEVGYQVLVLAGWDTQSYDYLWQGNLERKGDFSLLHLADGSILPLAGSAVSAPDGQKVFVEGFLKDGSLDWTVIQDYVENSAPGQNVDQLVSIDKVELAYLAPQITQSQPNMPDSIAMRTLQPVWVFSGQTASGDLIQVFVQAIEPTLINP